MQEVIDNFIRELLSHKDLNGVDDEVVEQLVADMSKRLNDQINGAIIARLNDPQLKELEELAKKGADASKMQQLINNAGIDTTKVATQVMQEFRKGYLGE